MKRFWPKKEKNDSNPARSDSKAPANRAERSDGSGSNDSKTLKIVYPYVLILLGLSALLLIGQPFFVSAHPEARTFIEELAFAGVLAGFFSLTVEKYHRQEFRDFVIREEDKLKQNIFLYAYAHNLSDQTRQEIRDLLECPFHREQLRLEWHMTSIPDKPDKIRIVKTFTYIQKNGTMQPKPYDYRLHLNTASAKKADEDRSVLIRRPNEDDLRLPGDEGKLESDKIGLIQPEGHLEVSATIAETRLKAGDDAYSSRHPVTGISLITVTVDASLSLKVLGFCKGKELSTRADHAPERGYYAWELHEGTLPFQAILISWDETELDKTLVVAKTDLQMPTPNNERAAKSSPPAIQALSSSAS
jgi:hypothetical protein